MAYDAYLTMRNAIEAAGSTDAEAIRDALFATDGFVGAAGAITLDENHDAVRPVVFKVVEADGSTTFKDMIEPYRPDGSVLQSSSPAGEEDSCLSQKKSKGGYRACLTQPDCCKRSRTR